MLGIWAGQVMLLEVLMQVVNKQSIMETQVFYLIQIEYFFRHLCNYLAAAGSRLCGLHSQGMWD